MLLLMFQVTTEQAVYHEQLNPVVEFVVAQQVMQKSLF
jgi:hypothetical protein